MNAANGSFFSNGIAAPAAITRVCATDQRLVVSLSAPRCPGGEKEKSGNGMSRVVAALTVGENIGGGFCPFSMPSRP